MLLPIDSTAQSGRKKAGDDERRSVKHSKLPPPRTLGRV
jgi:hypothetical protein